MSASKIACFEYLAERGGRLIQEGDQWAVVDRSSSRGPWGVTAEDAVRHRAQDEWEGLKAERELAEKRLAVARENEWEFRNSYGDLLVLDDDDA